MSLYTGRFRRKGKYFGGDNIGHCEKKAYMKMCLTLNDYLDTPAWVKSFTCFMYIYIFISFITFYILTNSYR
jgi:hypothetical protein